MVKINFYKIRPLALKYFSKNIFHIFLFSGIFFSFLSLSITSISIIHAQRRTDGVLGTNDSLIKKKTVQTTNRLASSNIIEVEKRVSTPTPTKTRAKPTPIKKQANTPTPVPTKSEINKPEEPSPTSNLNKQYTAEKIGDSTYRVSNVTNDTQMASIREIFDALNEYRRSHGRTTLLWDNALEDFAKGRVDLFDSNNSLDSHAGFKSFMDNDGFSKIGFNGLGENSAMLSGNMKGERIIKEIFGADSDHDSNQLEASWQYAGIGVKGKAVNVNFGKNKR